MKIKVKIEREVDVKYITVFAKVCDMGSYSILDSDKQLVYELPEGSYVPSIVPSEHGDYLDFVIDLDTGQIANWKKPSVEAIRDIMSRD